MPKIILPPKYYLTHFFEFLDFIETHYLEILEPSSFQFIQDFKNLSEDAQCAYIRMINRKGFIFDRKNFQKYKEIENISAALDELETKGFIDSLKKKDALNILTFLPKPQLSQWLQLHGLEFSKSLTRDEIVHIGREILERLDLDKIDHSDLIAQRRTNEIEYLMFLYFGRIQKNMTLYTLRDLGIRSSSTLKNKFKPRFISRAAAHAEYFFAQQLEEDLSYATPEQLRALFLEIQKYQNLLGTTQNLKDELLLLIADLMLEKDMDLALKAWAESRHPLAREKSVRTLYKINLIEDCLAILENIQSDPRSDEELLFAEDFLARKFNKKKRGQLSEILLNSEQITVSDFYLKRPELGVINYLETQNQSAWFAENYLWVSLFGVLFWDELFESDLAAIHNPFERSPADLIGLDFYQKHEKSLEEKLSAFENRSQVIKIILKNISDHYGQLNDLFQWNTKLAETLVQFLNKSQKQNVAYILRAMAKNFENNHSGFPDLLVEKNGVLRFIEVKAEGDVLRTNQLGKFKLLKEAGFEVEVLRVQWQADPHQVYVVIDVETTGGSSQFHRVTEIGAVKIQDGKVIDEFQTLINPARPIPPFITQITGITDEMVAEAPQFSEIASSFLDFIGNGLFVAHNVKFDYSFIQKEFARAEMEFVRPQLCTCAGMRKAYPGLKSYGLKNLTEHFNIRLDQHHRALNDARAAAELLLLMNEKRSLPQESVIIYENLEHDKIDI